MQKEQEGSAVVDSLSAFGFVASEVPWPDVETCAVATREWPGEHGEDAYISPVGLTLKAYDLSVEFYYKGEVESAYPAYKTLRDYLIGADGRGAALKIFDPYWNIGRRRVWAKKIGDPTPARTNIDEFLSVKVTFHVSDPTTDLTVGLNARGEIINLGAV